MSINCRVSFKNNELEVVDKNGQPSKLYYDALELTGNEDKAFDLWYKAFSQEFTEQVKANRDDVTLDEVLKFVSVNSSFRKSLDISEVREIKDIMDKNSFETLSSFHNTLKDIFRPEGVTELNTRKAYESGLYDLESLSEINLDEIDDLLDKIEGTLLKTDIYVTPSSDTSANFIDTSRRTILGTPEFISQEEIEEEIITKVENTKDSSQISSLINNLPYGSFAERFNSEEPFRNQILKNVGAYTKVNTLFIENGIPTIKNLTHFSNLKRTLGTNNKTVGLAADIEFLKEMSDTVWAENQEEVKDVLRDIAFYQFNDNNIDIFGLDKNSSNKKVILDTLNSLGEMLKNPTNESILNFSDKFSALVPQPTSLASEILPENLEPFAQNIFKVHSNLSESELFRDHGLIKVASNLYHKVDLGNRSNLYEQLYQKAKEEGSPIYLKSEDKQEGLRELEKYVMLQDSPLEKDVKEEHILNKLIFNHPKIQDTNDYSQLSDITTDPEYLVGGFPTDFSDYIVTEKQKDSQLYRSTLSKFRVGESGVYLISPVNSIEGIDFQKELEDYIRLSKDQSMKYLLPAKTSSLSKGVDLRAINDPLSVPTYSRQYSVDNGLLVTETTPSDNIRFYGKTYSKVAEDTKNSVFKQVPVNPNNNFYSINNNFITEEDKSIASQILNDAKFSFVDSAVTKQDFDNSIEKAGIQNEVRFSIFGETAARNLDKLEGTNRRIDNLEKAIGMDQELRDKEEYKGSDGKANETMIARAIKIATEWEKGIDGIWRFESNDERAKLNFGIKTKADITKVRTLGEVLNYPELFDAYPTIKDVKVFFDTEAGNFEDAYSLYTDTYKEIGLGYREDTLLESIDDLKVLNKYSAETISALINKQKMFVYGDRLDRLVLEGKISIDDVYPMLDERFSPDKVEEWNKQLLKDGLVEEELNMVGTPYEYTHYKLNKNYFDVARILESQKSESYISTENLNEKLKSTLLHEIQHIIQKEEGFAEGGNTKIALYVMNKDQYKKYEELVEKSKEVSIYVLGQNREATQEEYDIITAPNSMAHAIYKRLAGEVEARNVEDRLNIPWSMRKKLLLQKTEELARVDQIVYKAKDIVLNLKKNLDTKTTTDQVIDKLKESKLATNVRLMTSKEISKQLEDIGVDIKTRRQISAYHGSPFSFDKFTTSKIGTGEGSQAFGWGLYFTDVKSIAEYYSTRNVQTLTNFELNGIRYKTSFKEDGSYETTADDEVISESEYYKAFSIYEKNRPAANLYKVSLHKGKTPDQYTWLEWDKPVTKELKDKVRVALNELGIDTNSIGYTSTTLVDGKPVKTAVPDKDLIEDLKTGKDLYEAIAIKFNGSLIEIKKKASLLLLDLGIDGIKFPAESISRGATSDTARGFNYVVFDENAISIEDTIKFQKQLDSIPEVNKEELAQDYFVREADRLPLTLSVFNRPEFIKMQGKVVNKISILNSLNQSGIKQIEKDLIKNVIEDYYKDQTKVSYDEVEATVRANIMPLEVLNTDSYSNYGMENLNEGDYGDANTIIFNSPIEHGVVGHFSSSFISKNREDLKYVPKQLNNNTWVAVQEDYEDQANGNNIYQFVGTAGTQEDVNKWIDAYNNPTNFIDLNDKSLKLEISEVSPSTKAARKDEDIVDIQLLKNGEVLRTERAVTRTTEAELKEYIVNSYNKDQANKEPAINKGMFGHIRVWTDGDIYNVAELQSDYFQNNNARKKTLEKNTEYNVASSDKSDKLKTLREKRESSLISLRDSGYIVAYDRAEVKSKVEVFKALNVFGEELGKREKVEAVKTDDKYAISVNGELYTRTFFYTKDLAENEIEKGSKRLDFDTTEKNNQPLSENEMPNELKDAFNFVTKGFYTEEKNIEKEFNNTVDSIIVNLPLVEKQFIASQKEWEKRMVREALKLASSSGAKKLRFPTPHTLSVIEGYISGGGAPYEILSADNYDRLSPGDRVDYLGADSTVISSNRDEIEIVLSEDVRKQDIEEYIDSEVEYFTNEVINYELGLDFESQYTEEEFNDANKHSSIEGLDLEDIAKKVDDDLYEISRDKVEQAVRDYFSIFYNEDNIESVLSDQGYENINVDGRFVYYTDRGIYTETLSQPDEYSDADKDTFSISDLTDTQQTVANKYVELAEILRKEVGEDNVETVTDDQGFDWYETDVEDKYSNKAVVAFKKGLSEKGAKPIVNGFVYNNEVFLNKDSITEETPIHEFNHLFTDWLKKNRPSVYKKGISLVNEELTKEDSDIASVINYVKQTQPDLQGEKLLEEILTELTGREGAALIESGRKSGIIEWLKNFFKEIGNMLGILDATPAQVANMTVREFAKSSAVQLLKGEDIMSKMNSLRDSISNATTFSSEYTPVNDTVDSVAEELRACN